MIGELVEVSDTVRASPRELGTARPDDCGSFHSQSLH
jgi:hypothetical protein